MNEPIKPEGSLYQRVGVLSAAGLLGVATLVLQPIPASLLRTQPAFAEWSVWTLKLLGLLNPVVFLLTAAVCGALVAHRVGLRSHFAGTAGHTDLKRGWRQSVALGLLTGVLLAGLDVALAPLVGPSWEQYVRHASQPTPQQLLIGILYGGITEEILMRWGLMSILAWAIWVLCGKQRPEPALLVAAVLTSLVFGAAHLPALAVQVELTNAIVVRTLVLNGLAALVYAWIFWHHHLEAAMLSHACSHLGMGAVWWAL